MTHPPGSPPIDGMSYTQQEAFDARRRPVGQRTPIPEVGARVLYRADAYGPLVGATVTAVEMDNQEDLNVWRFKTEIRDGQRGPVLDAFGRRVMELVDDPWPDVILKIDGRGGMHATREARIPGSPGWLWREAS